MNWVGETGLVKAWRSRTRGIRKRVRPWQKRVALLLAVVGPG